MWFATIFRTLVTVVGCVCKGPCRLYAGRPTAADPFQLLFRILIGRTGIKRQFNLLTNLYAVIVCTLQCPQSTSAVSTFSQLKKNKRYSGYVDFALEYNRLKVAHININIMTVRCGIFLTISGYSDENEGRAMRMYYVEVKFVQEIH